MIRPRSGSKVVVLVVLALAMGAAGLFTGRMIRSKRDAGQVVEQRTPFAIGDAFPDVKLATAWGDTTSSNALAAGRDVVVLFLDPECPPCVDMAKKWNAAIQDEVVDPQRVFAVIDGRHAAAGVDMLAQAAPALRAYSDVNAEFMTRHGVTSFPYMVAVSETGAVRYASGDQTIDPTVVASNTP